MFFSGPVFFSGSVRPLPSHSQKRRHPNGFDQDVNIQPDGVVLDVEDVVFGVEVHRFVTAAINRLPARDVNPLRLPSAPDRQLAGADSQPHLLNEY